MLSSLKEEKLYEERSYTRSHATSASTQILYASIALLNLLDDGKLLYMSDTYAI